MDSVLLQFVIQTIHECRLLPFFNEFNCYDSLKNTFLTVNYCCELQKSYLQFSQANTADFEKKIKPSSCLAWALNFPHLGPLR